MKKIIVAVAGAAIVAGGFGVAQASVINDKLDSQQIANVCNGVVGSSVDASVDLMDGSTVKGTVDCSGVSSASTGNIPSVDLKGINLGDEGMERSGHDNGGMLFGENENEREHGSSHEREDD